MKTIVVFRTYLSTFRFFAVEGDYSHLLDACIGCGEAANSQELLKFIYDDNGNYKLTEISFETARTLLLKSENKLILCGEVR